MRFWLAMFVILLLVLDVMWMLDGFLTVQYGESYNQKSYRNESTLFSYTFFADRPVKNLYYRVIISLLVFIGIILAYLSIGKMSKYRDLLDASNLKYKSLFMGMKSGFALRKIYRDSKGNITDIKFLEVNPAFSLHTGLGNIDLVNKSISDVFTNRDLLVKEYDKIARYGGSFTKIHESENLGKILRITAYQHTEDTFVTLVEDITREKQTEDELLESSQLKTILLDTISESVYYVDTDLNIVWVNNQVLELMGKDEKEVLGKKCYHIWKCKNDSCSECPFSQNSDTWTKGSFEMELKNGRYLQVHNNPVYDSEQKLKGGVITIFDLTDWKEAIDKLQQKQEQLNLALEAGNMTVWKWNAEDQMVKLEQTRYLKGDADNKWSIESLQNQINSHDRAEFDRQKDAIISGDSKEMSMELRIKNDEGKWVWFNLQGRVKESTPDGESLKLIGLIYNIDRLKTIATELKAANQELTELKNKLEKEVAVRLAELRDKDLLMIRQSRQAAMGEMIGNIAHQWRQPLNSIAVIIQDFVDAWDFGELTRDYLADKIDLSMSVINHMSQTIDDFRDFFSPDKQPMSFDLDKQIIKTISILKDMYVNQGIKINSDLLPCSITSYAREFSQVLINILNNAKDALMENKIKDPVIDIELSQKTGDRFITIKIEDNAGGIKEEILDKIFDPYFTTKKSSNGTGVGLYMSKNIIEKHMNGTLTAENTEKGALFTITLPLD